MKVLLVHNRYRSAAPSGENRVVDTESAALARRGHDVGRFEVSSDDIAGWPAHRRAALPLRVVHHPQAHAALAERLRRDRPDVVHVHNTFPLLGASVLDACRDAGVPVVATVHNYKLLCASGDFFRDGAVCHDCADGRTGPALRHGCYRGSTPATVPVVAATVTHRRAWRTRVSAYVFISDAQRRLFAGLRLDPRRVFVKHNLVLPDEGQPAPAPPAGGAEHAVAYLGRLDDAKGVRLLLAAWDAYRAAAGDHRLRLVVAGRGPLADEVDRWAATRPSVSVAGLLPPAAGRALLARCRAVVLPSTWEETFGLVAVEAMAVGVPPLAAGHGSFLELVTDGVDGALFPAGDAAGLARLLADVDRCPERYAALGRAARTTYEKRHDPEENLDQLLDVYRFATTRPA